MLGEKVNTSLSGTTISGTLPARLGWLFGRRIPGGRRGRRSRRGSNAFDPMGSNPAALGAPSDRVGLSCGEKTDSIFPPRLGQSTLPAANLPPRRSSFRIHRSPLDTSPVGFGGRLCLRAGFQFAPHSGTPQLNENWPTSLRQSSPANAMASILKGWQPPIKQGCRRFVYFAQFPWTCGFRRLNRVDMGEGVWHTTATGAAPGDVDGARREFLPP